MKSHDIFGVYGHKPIFSLTHIQFNPEIKPEKNENTDINP